MPRLSSQTRGRQCGTGSANAALAIMLATLGLPFKISQSRKAMGLFEISLAMGLVSTFTSHLWSLTLVSQGLAHCWKLA